MPRLVTLVHMKRTVEVVLFDLGGVLIELTGVPKMLDLTGMADATVLWQRWLACPWVRKLETGQCGAADFAAGLVEEWQLRIEPEAFLDAFAQWPVGPLPGAEELVRAAKRNVAVGCLSNTNELHWRGSIGTWPILDHFDHQFASHEMGLLKPDTVVFEHVAERLGVAPDRVVFLDDNLANVEGAAAVGFQAFHTVGVEQARDALTIAGVV